jgi:Uncharacterized protein conserved in bacteria (DUF2188)
MAKQKLRQIDVVKKRSGWVAETKSGRTFAKAPTKRAVVKRAASKARSSSRPTSVRIHGRDGRIQEERTYPRSADPPSNKG